MSARVARSDCASPAAGVAGAGRRVAHRPVGVHNGYRPAGHLTAPVGADRYCRRVPDIRSADIGSKVRRAGHAAAVGLVRCNSAELPDRRPGVRAHPGAPGMAPRRRPGGTGGGRAAAHREDRYRCGRPLLAGIVASAVAFRKIAGSGRSVAVAVATAGPGGLRRSATMHQSGRWAWRLLARRRARYPRYRRPGLARGAAPVRAVRPFSPAGGALAGGVPGA
jgi:hypothetical protein